MVTSIKGTVTRVVSDTNFFIRASSPDEATLRFINLDGHRVGVEELSAEKVNANKPRFKPYKGELPAAGDEVTLDLVEPYDEG
ncbi:MAG TPA: hypothetical protein VE074_13875 [Jatrophihabitantaceae bacterium]|nr:hypothetical protein [Jatrophihabitantaceae bacterium]